MLKQDLRNQPIRRLVIMGESNAYGMNACAAEYQWAQVLGQHIRMFQDGPLRIFNHAIPSNVISPDAPGYKAGDFYKTAPSAIERYQDDMIAYEPDLAVFAYGLNDSRCGHSVESFMEAYREVVMNTAKACPDALIVLAGPYWNLQYDSPTWSKPEHKGQFGVFGVPGDELVLAYNREIKKMAEEMNAIFVDLYRNLEGAQWLLTKDACHFNDVGQYLIGQQVFNAIAIRCSFLAHSSRRAEDELSSSVWTTGGADALPHVIKTWRKPDLWNGKRKKKDW